MYSVGGVSTAGHSPATGQEAPPGEHDHKGQCVMEKHDL